MKIVWEESDIVAGKKFIIRDDTDTYTIGLAYSYNTNSQWCIINASVVDLYASVKEILCYLNDVHAMPPGFANVLGIAVDPDDIIDDDDDSQERFDMRIPSR